MSNWLSANSDRIKKGNVIRANRIFPRNTRQSMLNVHLYFVKQFGCKIAGTDIPIDIKPFADAIMHGCAHPLVLLRIVRAPFFSHAVISGQSEMKAAVRRIDESCRFAMWMYVLDTLAVDVMFAAEGERRQGQVGAWHPRFGTNKLLVSDS
jgi:hypothetical protein